MITQLQNIKAKTFMGLMAAEGLVPGATSAKEIPEDFFNRVYNNIAEIKAPGMSFFDLMVEAGQMKPVNYKPSATLIMLPMIRITRPSALGGEMPLAA